MTLETFKKLPLGGVDRRAIVGALAKDGLRVATELLDQQRRAVRPAGTSIAPDAAVLVLGGSNGITRAITVQLLFGERARVYAVHYDSEKMQIGPFHVQAMKAAADAESLKARFWNDDATRPQAIEQVLAALEADGVRAVHLVNGIAAGATKRYAEHGPIQVKDLDVAFDPVLQVPDFSLPENVRRVGLVDVEVATDVDIERTNRFMGSSSLLWAEPLASAGMLVRGESVVAFCDYDFAPDDPVYAMGPLAGAKILQRRTMGEIEKRFGARTARICYPPVATTALGAIPGGLLMYGLSAQILKERGQFRDVMELGVASMGAFRADFAGGELHLDEAYKAALSEFDARKERLTSADLPGALRLLYQVAMKGIIIGAGRGSRLRHLTEEIPKTLVPILGRPMLDGILDALAQGGLRPPEVVFICGYLAGTIQARYPALDYVENPEWERNNILASLMFARSRMEGGFVSTYADIVYRPAVVEALVRSPHDLTVVCDTAWRRRYTGRSQHPETDAEKLRAEGTRVVEMSRRIASEAASGEFIGVMKASPAGAARLCRAFDEARAVYAGKEFREGRSFEKAYLIDLLQHMIEQGEVIHRIDTDGGYMEIDTLEDAALSEGWWRASGG